MNKLIVLVFTSLFLLVGCADVANSANPADPTAQNSIAYGRVEDKGYLTDSDITTISKWYETIWTARYVKKGDVIANGGGVKVERYRVKVSEVQDLGDYLRESGFAKSAAKIEDILEDRNFYRYTRNERDADGVSQEIVYNQLVLDRLLKILRKVAIPTAFEFPKGTYWRNDRKSYFNTDNINEGREGSGRQSYGIEFTSKRTFELHFFDNQVSNKAKNIRKANGGTKFRYEVLLGHFFSQWKSSDIKFTEKSFTLVIDDKDQIFNKIR